MAPRFHTCLLPPEQFDMANHILLHMLFTFTHLTTTFYLSGANLSAVLLSAFFHVFFPANSTIVVTPPPPMLLCTSSPKFSERPPLPFISYRVISFHLHTIACHINQLHSTFQTLIFLFLLDFFFDPNLRSFRLFSSLRWPHTRQGQVY